ncbi:MAG: hypothetical protein M0R74_10455 [Dehalococcoidia bacterium]|nr:hypothetical protein [Dehalococcoidia bacterium]
MRVSPPRIIPQVSLAPKPPLAAPGADAYRQTGFVLGKDLDLIVRGLEIEGQVAEASSGAKFRTQRMVSALGLWSRSWLCRLEALHAVQGGNYAAALPLIRSAADYQAAEVYLLRSDAAEWNEWLEQGGIGNVHELHAAEFRLHSFRAAEVLAAHPDLGALYRAATDLSLPHFGSTLLLAAAESSPDRVLMTFGDRDFHLGLAELALGWLALLSAVQLESVLESGTVFALPDGADPGSFIADARTLITAPGRCGVEPVEHEGMSRYLVQNWRRQPGAAPKRIVL